VHCITIANVIKLTLELPHAKQGGICIPGFFRGLYRQIKNTILTLDCRQMSFTFGDCSSTVSSRAGGAQCTSNSLQQPPKPCFNRYTYLLVREDIARYLHSSLEVRNGKVVVLGWDAPPHQKPSSNSLLIFWRSWMGRSILQAYVATQVPLAAQLGQQDERADFYRIPQVRVQHIPRHTSGPR
jgi:hypothetical protein